MSAPASHHFVYAKALLKASGKEAQSVAKSLREFLDYMQQNPDHWAAIIHPQVSANEQKAVIGKIFDQEVCARDFLFVAVDHHRLKELEQLVVAFERVVEKASAVSHLIVTTAITMSPTMQVKLHDKIRKELKQEIELEFIVDNSMIGGLRIQYGDAIMDESLSGRLNTLHQTIKKLPMRPNADK
jgi:F-type H+-transporting ATPase subunit delta